MPGAEGRLAQGPPDQVRVRGQHDLRDAHLIAQPLVMAVLHLQLRQPFRGGELLHRGLLTRDEQVITRPQFGSRERRHQRIGKASLAADADDRDAVAGAQPGLCHGLASERGIPPQVQPVKMNVQPIARHQFLQGRPPPAEVGRGWAHG